MTLETRKDDRPAADDLYRRITIALQEMRGSLDGLTVEDLAPVDHFHARGLAGTIELADTLPAGAGDRLLDIGCGLGGPARFLANRFGCHVTGVDIDERSIEVAHRLTGLLSMGDQVAFEAGDALDLPFAGAVFDGGYAQHATMNLPDRDRFAVEVSRVLKPGAFFALSEHILGPSGEPHYPTPWSEDGSDSFLTTADQTRAALERAGFVEIHIEDVSSVYLGFYQHVLDLAANGKLPRVGPQLILGDGVGVMLRNMAANLEEGRTGAIVLTGRKNR